MTRAICLLQNAQAEGLESVVKATEKGTRGRWCPRPMGGMEGPAAEYNGGPVQNEGAASCRSLPAFRGRGAPPGRPGYF